MSRVASLVVTARTETPHPDLPIRMLNDRVLFDPEDRAEVELAGSTYLLLREKDVHAGAEPRGEGQGTGLYL